MPTMKLSNFLLHRELILENHLNPKPFLNILHCRKENKGAVCPKCASLATAGYDSRKVRIRDEPVRGAAIWLVVKKKRFYCKKCKKPFTEPLPGVLPRRRTTHKYRKAPKRVEGQALLEISKEGGVGVRFLPWVSRSFRITPCKGYFPRNQS